MPLRPVATTKQLKRRLSSLSHSPGPVDWSYVLRDEEGIGYGCGLHDPPDGADGAGAQEARGRRGQGGWAPAGGGRRELMSRLPACTAGRRQRARRNTLHQAKATHQGSCSTKPALMAMIRCRMLAT